MLDTAWQSISQFTTLEAVLWGLALAALLEVATCVARFGLGLQATRDTAWLAPFTGGLRIHHGYVGVLLLLPAMLVNAAGWWQLLLMLAVGLAVSDLVHHFLVLWPIVGTPEFHLRYPK